MRIGRRRLVGFGRRRQDTSNDQYCRQIRWVTTGCHGVARAIPKEFQRSQAGSAERLWRPES